MKKAIIILFLFIPVLLNATNYYVAPTGNDSNPGTINQPFFTLNKAWKVISAGDIVYMRGGTYKYTVQQYLTGKSGTAGNLIKIWAYPGESPIITRYDNNWTWNQSVQRTGVWFEGDYVHWKGIEITGFTQITTYMWYGMNIPNSNHNIFELLNIHHNGIGFGFDHKVNDNLVLNCDFHHNYDPITSGDEYGNADGASIYTDAGSTNTFRGCRFWNNSDDGVDTFGSDGLIIFDGCWSWKNGYKENGTTIGGNGAGFKMGAELSPGYPTTHLRTIQNCLAFHNKGGGFAQNVNNQITWVFNNTAYHNADGADVYNLGFEFASTSSVHILKNNIAYSNQHPVNLEANWESTNKQDHNTWNGALTASDADFISLDANQATGSRQSDGSLPVMTFLHLAAGSKLIDAGVDVGLPYIGKSADVGAYETQSGSTATAPVPVPVFISAVIENATPSVLAMTYDLSLNNLIAPPVSSFIVLVNSVPRAVNSLAISGSKVQLTLASAVKQGDIISASYTKPAANPLQTASGGQATNLTAQPIVNKIAAAVTNPTTSSIKMTINPNPVHQIINILFEYTAFTITDVARSPQIIRIFNTAGKLYIEKVIVTGIAKILLPINLRPGIYTVVVLSGGLQMASQIMRVY